eukprot:9236865-Alexandrium_andersonii.AAC.1
MAPRRWASVSRGSSAISRAHCCAASASASTARTLGSERGAAAAYAAARPHPRLADRVTESRLRAASERCGGPLVASAG